MWRLISYHKENGFFWIRILGYGFTIKNPRTHPLLFSQRNGYTKVYKIGKYVFYFLNPNKN